MSSSSTLLVLTLSVLFDAAQAKATYKSSTYAGVDQASDSPTNFSISVWILISVSVVVAMIICFYLVRCVGRRLNKRNEPQSFEVGGVVRRSCVTGECADGDNCSGAHA
ncbi:hypothetical protein EDC01DRAFT_92540 [Geopyxis carbonaria]|nr:hypothetical protein EDC01DRAFT_92540 [Geopyxis carbonaria]